MVRSDNHLRNALSTECLATDELLLSQSCQSVAYSRQSQEDSCGNQTASIHYDAEKLNHGHHAIDCCSHVVGGESADESVELGRCRTDSKQERNLNKDKHQRRTSVVIVSDSARKSTAAPGTYMRIMLNMMRRLKWKMLAMPKANPRIMHNTPSL